MEPFSWIAEFYWLINIVVFHVSLVKCESLKRNNFGLAYANFVKNPYSKLTASHLATVKVSSLGHCTLECINHKQCVSVNFGEDQSQAKQICELIKTDKFNTPEKFTASQDFHHYNIKVSWFRNLLSVITECLYTLISKAMVLFQKGCLSRGPQL